MTEIFNQFLLIALPTCSGIGLWMFQDHVLIVFNKIQKVKKE